MFFDGFGPWMFAIALGMSLVLALSAMRSERLNFRDGWKMAAIWVALFLLVAMVFAWVGM